MNEPEQAQKLLDKLKQVHPNITPSFDVATAILDCWISLVHHHSLKLQDSILTLASDDPIADANWEDIINTLKLMIHAAEKAESLVHNMEKWSEQTQQHGDHRTQRRCLSGPSSHHYDVVIAAWAKVIFNCPRILEILPKRGQDKRYAVFRSIFHGIPQRATLLLETMERLAALSERAGVQPTVDTYNAVLDIWTCSEEHNRRSMAQSIFNRMMGTGSINHWDLVNNITAGVLQVMPSRKTFQVMIQAWCRLDSTSFYIQSSCAFHATHYLLQMHSLLEKGLDDFEPTLMDYKNVLQAWMRSAGSKKSAYRALSILHKLESLYAKRQTQIRPDTECYEYSLQTLAKVDPVHMQDAGERVDRIFINMNDRNLLPDSGCFSAAIQTWSHMATHHSATSATKALECIQRAEQYLKQMSETYHRSSTVVVRPETIHYNMVLEALAEISSPLTVKRAEHLLHQMEILSNGGDVNVQPNTLSYSSVIRCWGRSLDAHPLDEAHKLLEHVLTSYNEKHEQFQPSTELFNAMLSVCASEGIHANDHEKALRYAFNIIQRMKSIPNCEPDSHSFSLLIQTAGQRIIPSSDRSKALVSIFNACCYEGLVDTEVIKSLQKYSAEELYKKLLKPSIPFSGSIGMMSNLVKTLPSEWTTNVKGKKVKLEDGRKIPIPLKMDGTTLNNRNPILNERRMKRIRSKVNQRLLRGGRLQE